MWNGPCRQCVQRRALIPAASVITEPLDFVAVIALEQRQQQIADWQRFAKLQIVEVD